MILKKLIYTLLILLVGAGCSIIKRVNIEEEVLMITRKYVGTYLEYRYVDPGWRYPNTCWIKTSFDTIYGKIPVAGKEINFVAGEPLYLRRVYMSLPGNAGGFWYYQLESDRSKYTYPLRGNKGATTLHDDIFNIPENDTEL